MSSLRNIEVNLRPKKAAPSRLRRDCNRRQVPTPSQEHWLCPACGVRVFDVCEHLLSGDCAKGHANHGAWLVAAQQATARSGEQAHQRTVAHGELRCDVCGDDTCAVVTVLDHCGHALGARCRDELAAEIANDPTWTVERCACRVPHCDAHMSAAELRTAFPATLVATLQERSLSRFLAPDTSSLHRGQRVVSCPSCRLAIELAGEPPLDAADDADACFSAFRIRCRGCETTYCARCNESPYHAGKTCAEARRRAAAVCTCRFCGSDVAPDAAASEEPLPEDCCSLPECRALAKFACCGLVGDCGHPCYGVPGDPCTVCMTKECTASQHRSHPNTTAEDLCGICFTDELRYRPCVTYPCGHAFHHECVGNRLRARWPGHRITFGYMGCPMCGADVTAGDARISPSLHQLLEPHFAFRKRVEELVALRARREGLDDAAGDDEALIRAGMQQLAFYECSKCSRPYFGGYQRCEAAMADAGDAEADREAADRNRHELVCGGCVEDSERVRCPAHGTAFIEYKCKFCCSVATYFCWGRTHFCSDCHRRQDRGEYLTRKPLSELPICPAESGGCCPLGVNHPANGGAEFALGCALCRERATEPPTSSSTVAVDDNGAAAP